MRAPVSWIREFADLPADLTTDDLAARLTDLGLKLEAIHRLADDITGPLVVGRVLTMEAQPQKNGKTINWCTVDVGSANGTGDPQGIVCGAHNFEPGDLVVTVLPGGVLPGGFEISARKTYGHTSAGMICSAAELGLGEDHDGIIVLASDAGDPGQDASGVLGLDEEVIEFEINPDRAYALSLRGVAREAALGFSVAFTDPADRPVAAYEDATDEPAYPVEVEDPEGCPVFSGRSVTGFDPTAPTPSWMAERIRGAGMRPISLAVDVTNYVMLELGQPIHGFDRTTLQGPIRVRRASDGETLETLDGKTRTLHSQDLLITDDSGPIGLAGVMGGAHTELGPDTTEIFIEAAHWDPVSIFRTERRHKLPSEAAKRFERGTDPTLTLRAADRVAELLTTHGGGQVEPGVTHVGDAAPREAIDFDLVLPARITGVSIAPETSREHLVAVGCEVTLEGEGPACSVTPPPWRPDLNDPFDLVEEVARIVGYDQVPSLLPKRAVGAGLTKPQRLRRRVGRVLAGAGCAEVISFPFLGSRDLDALGVSEVDPRRRLVRLANPISSEAPFYATTLLPGLLHTAARNISRGAEGVSIFEVGTVAFATDTENGAPVYGVDGPPQASELSELLAALPVQPWHVGAVLAGEIEATGWWGKARYASWADAVDLVRRLATETGVELTVQAESQTPWHPGRCAAFVVGNEVVGHAGELHPRVCDELDLPKRTAAMEIDLDRFIAAAPEVVPAPAFSTYPVVKEDVALVVRESVAAEEIATALREGAGDLLESVRLFDVYRGDQVPEGHKSCAFSLRFRAPDRTLTDAETHEARGGAIQVATDRLGAQLR